MAAAGSSSSSAPPIYRNTTVGVALLSTLNEFVTQGKIAPAMALRLLAQFDETIDHVLQFADQGECPVQIEGNLDNYRNVDNVWMFDLKNARIPKMGIGMDPSKPPLRLKVTATQRPQ